MQNTEIDMSPISHLVMCSGVGDGKTTACVMAQAATLDALRKGQSLDEPTDKMDCACPVLRRLAIRANDSEWWESDAERSEFLRPLIPLLLDSRGDLALTDNRAAMVADNCARVLTPMRLRFIAENTKDTKKKAHALEGAEAMESLAPITDKASALAAREICKKWRHSAYAYAYVKAQKRKYRDAFLALFREVHTLGGAQE